MIIRSMIDRGGSAGDRARGCRDGAGHGAIILPITGTCALCARLHRESSFVHRPRRVHTLIRRAQVHQAAPGHGRASLGDVIVLTVETADGHEDQSNVLGMRGHAWHVARETSTSPPRPLS